MNYLNSLPLIVLTTSISLFAMELPKAQEEIANQSNRSTPEPYSFNAEKAATELNSSFFEDVFANARAKGKENNVVEMISYVKTLYPLGAMNWMKAFNNTKVLETLRSELMEMFEEGIANITRKSIGIPPLEAHERTHAQLNRSNELTYPTFISTIKADLLTNLAHDEVNDTTFTSIISRARNILKMGDDKVWACLVLESLCAIDFPLTNPSNPQLKKLILAIEINDTGLLDFWISNFLRAPIISPADLNRSEFQTTPLTSATACCSLEMVRVLVEAGASVNLANHVRETPLMMAAYLNKVDILRFLLHHKANTTVRNENNLTALHLAVINRSHNSLEELILNDPQLKVNLEVVSIIGETPLLTAIKLSDSRSVELLLNAGANPNILFSTTPALHFAITMCGLEKGGNFTWQKVNGDAYESSLAIVFMLMNNQFVLPILTTTEGHTAVALAERYNLPQVSNFILSRHSAL